MHPAMSNRNDGFTLVELITVLAIAAVVASTALPSYKSLVMNSRVQTSLYQLMAHLKFARGEAIKRGFSVALCASNDQATCNGGNQWESGYIVFVNINGDQVVDPGETVLRATTSSDPSITIRSAAFGNGIGYQPSAFTNVAGTFTVCDPRGASKARAVVVSATGRSSFARDNDGNGIYDDQNGNDLTCP